MVEGGAMTPAEINRAIADHLGWKQVEVYEWTTDGKTRPPKQWYEESDLPNYTRDLNAMHEAETIMTTDKDLLEYFNHLSQFVPPEGRSIRDSMDIVCATAAQRAEAFLRTVGKWKGEQ